MTSKGLWLCKVCGFYGTGGSNGFERHYEREHYLRLVK
jgi:hypothetical protein